MNTEFETTTIEEYKAVSEKECESEHSTVHSRKIGIEAIIDEVCKEAEVSPKDIIRRVKLQKYSDVKKAIVRLSEKYSDISKKELANMLNLPPSMISKIISGKSRGTHLVDELIRKIENKGIIQA